MMRNLFIIFMGLASTLINMDNAEANNTEAMSVDACYGYLDTFYDVADDKVSLEEVRILARATKQTMIDKGIMDESSWEFGFNLGIVTLQIHDQGGEIEKMRSTLNQCKATTKSALRNLGLIEEQPN